MLRNRGIRTRRADQVAAPTQPSAAADQAAQPAPEPVRVFGATGLAAMDVLPARSGGRGLLRRRSAPAERPLLADSGVPVTASGVLVGTGSGVAVGTGSGVLVGPVSAVAVGTAQAESSFAGIATTPAGPALAEVPAPESIAWSATPTQALPVAAAPTVAAPQPAPSSLFAPASAPVPEVSEIVPAQPVAPIAAPSSLFLPAPVQSEGAAAPAQRSSEPASVGAPEAGLTAAQSLRERSAMASEALS